MNYKKHFPFLQNGIYFNTASIGLTSTKVHEAKKKIDLRYHTDVFQLNLEEDEIINQVRKTVANYFGAKEDLTGLMPNFSFGMNALSEAIPKKSKILLLKSDYPSVNLPIESRDFEIRYALIDKNLEKNIIEALEDNEADYFIFSEVQFLNGIRLTEDFLHEIKTQFPKLKLICDATQSAGTRSFNFETSPFDAYGASAYKWLQAGWGNGFFLFKDSLIESLQPKSIGSNSKIYKPNGPLRKVGFLEPGHWDLNPFISLETALHFHFQEIGMNKIEKQIESLSEYTFKLLKQENVLEDSIHKRKIHSQIFNIQLSDSFLDLCIKNKILCAKRRNGIRISLNYFNTKNEVDQLVKLIQEFKNSEQ